MTFVGSVAASVNPPIVNVSVIESTEGLESLGKDWEQLLANSSTESIFNTWEWATVWWKSYGRGKQLRILKIVRNGQLIGLAPFYLETIRRFKALHYRTVRLIGDGSADSDYLDIISARGEEESVARAVVTHLVACKSRWDIVFLNEIPESASSVRLFRTLFHENHCYWSEIARPCSYVQLPADWNSYLLQLRPRMRTKIRSLMRQLEKDFTVDFNVCQNSAELGAGLESLFRLHEKRWMSKGEKGVFASHAKRNFYKELSHLLLGRGWLRFYTLAVNNLPVAHQYCFEYRNTMFLLQEGFDPEWDHYGVGNVLRSYVFRDCTERRVIAYDFLGGITDHKISWGAVPKNSVNAAALKPAVKNRLFLAVPDAVAAGKSQLRAMLPERVFRWRESWKRRRSGLTSQSQSTARKAPSESVRHSETEL